MGVELVADVGRTEVDVELVVDEELTKVTGGELVADGELTSTATIELGVDVELTFFVDVDLVVCVELAPVVLFVPLFPSDLGIRFRLSVLFSTTSASARQCHFVNICAYTT